MTSASAFSLRPVPRCGKQRHPHRASTSRLRRTPEFLGTLRLVGAPGLGWRRSRDGRSPASCFWTRLGCRLWDAYDACALSAAFAFPVWRRRHNFSAYDIIFGARQHNYGAPQSTGRNLRTHRTTAAPSCFPSTSLRCARP
ncbi:hypothetical protein VTO73DRAFT_15047 [Trametes versicolor]